MHLRLSQDLLYAPALYAEKSSCWDVALFLLLQNNVTIKPNEIAFDAIVSASIGQKINNNQLFLGIPDVIHEYLLKMQLTRFEIKSNRIFFFYHVEQQTKHSIKTFTGYKNKYVTHVIEQAISFFIFNQDPTIESLSYLYICHLWSMNKDKYSNSENGISLTKLR